MKKYILLLPLTLLAAAIIGTLLLGDDGQSPTTPKASSFQQPTHEFAQFDQVQHSYFALDPNAAVEHGHLQLIPIRASADYLKAHRHLPQLISLKAALASHSVIVRELGESAAQQHRPTYYDPNPLNTPVWPSGTLPTVSDELSQAMASGASVNSLVIENHSDTAIYIMSGEVVQGGKQDRVIAEDIIAMPGEKYIVPVFCVEPGRWQYQGDTPDAAAPAEESGEMIYAFTGYFNVASNSIRHTVKHEKSQSEVWARVGDVRNRNAVQGETTTYGDLARSQRFVKAQAAYLAALRDAFEAASDVVGVMAISGDKVLAMDVFATPQLFQQQYDGLLHAYLTEAITYGAAPTMEAKALSAAFEAAQRSYFERHPDEATELATKFVREGKVIHFAHLPLEGGEVAQ